MNLKKMHFRYLQEKRGIHAARLISVVLIGKHPSR